MKSEDVPETLVNAAYPVCLAYGIPWHDDAVKLILAAVLPEHEKQVRAQVAEEHAGWLAEVLHIAWALTLGQNVEPRHAMEALKEVPTAVLESARIPATWPPQGTGDAQDPGCGHGEGSDGEEAAQGRSEAQGGIRIYPTDDGTYAAADHAGWIPGTYPTEEAARQAAHNCGQPKEQA